MRVIILRHGETAANVERRIQGQSDTTLNARGEEQAEKVAEVLNEKEEIDAVYSSDLVRAWRTAEIIAGDRLDVIPETGLRERYMGAIEGMLHSEALKKRRAENLPSLLSYGEDGHKLTKRVLATWRKILKESQEKGYKTIVLVSHGSALYHLFESLTKDRQYSYANEEVQRRARRNTKLGNCCVTIIDDKKFVAYADQWTESIVRERTLV